MWRIKPYKVSMGWSVAMDLKEPLVNNYDITSNALDLTGVSNNDQYFTFTPKEDSNLWDGTTGATKYMMVSFEFSAPQAQAQVPTNDSIAKDIAKVEDMSNYYYKLPSDDQSCAVDRFDCYPLDT